MRVNRECICQFDEGRMDMTDAIDADAVKQFVMANRLPLVIEFTQDSAAKIFGGDVKNHMLLFVSKKADEFQSHFDTFKQVAQNFKGKVGNNHMDMITFNPLNPSVAIWVQL